ncbi:CBS domain-containing protein [Chloroflexota bacterium]
MKVRELLQVKSTALVTIDQEQTLLEASGLLNDHHIGVLLVVDAEQKPVGILSERDVVRLFAEKKDQCATVQVQEAMTKDLIVGLPSDDLSYVMHVMTQQRIRHLPVLDDETLVGLISIGDVVKAQVDQAKTEIRYLQSYITGIPDSSL